VLSTRWIEAAPARSASSNTTAADLITAPPYSRTRIAYSSRSISAISCAFSALAAPRDTESEPGGAQFDRLDGCPSDSSRPPSAFSASTSTSRTGAISSDPSETSTAQYAGYSPRTTQYPGITISPTAGIPAHQSDVRRSKESRSDPPLGTMLSGASTDDDGPRTASGPQTIGSSIPTHRLMSGFSRTVSTLEPIDGSRRSKGTGFV
jgi:hypothetical protein